MKPRWLYGVLALLACLLFLALLAAVILQSGLVSNPVFRLQMRIDLGTVLLASGLLGAVFLIGGMAVWRGVTQRQQHLLESTQQEASQTRQRFVRRLDHELRNPLAAIRTMLTYLSLDSSTADKTQTLQDIQTQVARLTRLTADLRKVAELETRVIERTPVDMQELLSEVADSLQTNPVAKTHPIRLLFPQAPWPLPPVMGDRDLLWLAFYNLLDNACKFTRPEDTIEIHAFEDHHQLTVQIADTGCGIAPEDLSHVFEELYRGQNARSVAGSGLGLALVRHIIIRHEGEITVQSRLEQGTIFSIRLPLSI